MNHVHDYHITLMEVLLDNSYRVMKECDCGDTVTEHSTTGDWTKQ